VEHIEVAPSISPDRTLLALAEALAAVDVALRSGDRVPMSDEVRTELTAKWMYIAETMVQHRARTVRGKRAKAITLQLLHEKTQPAPSLFVDLSISLALDLAAPLRRSLEKGIAL
jgi:hypothetical protein